MKDQDKSATSLLRVLQIGLLARQYIQLRLTVMKSTARRAVRRLGLAAFLVGIAIALILVALATGVAAVVLALHAAGFSMPAALAATGGGAAFLALLLCLVARSLSRNTFDL